MEYSLSYLDNLLPAYITFLESTENWALQIQRENQVLLVYHVLDSLRPTSPSPCVLRPRVPSFRPRPTFSHSPISASKIRQEAGV